MATEQERAGQLEAQLRSAMVEYEREKIEADREKAEAAEFAASPAGREKAAREALAAREAKAEKIALGRVLLQEEGFEKRAGVSVETLSEAQVMHFSRLGQFDANVASMAEKDAEADRLITSGAWARLDSADQWRACQALGISSPDVANRYAASIGAPVAKASATGSEGGEGDE